ncbi:hypothetical protein MAPG_00388 [Magnaporthiopsis poae ATCC 64411]|uniref:Uncharacterized protein n=1 Tax=Magnaporthiopsis poae (strain ATCC 64411 / 73-15) TaxID=644358 RepID=A0A0C4DKV6_MAGP6|nr:hypothetical protein MAPG_00388 [Magnaporthiopsis poae ATCC 64411]
MVKKEARKRSCLASRTLTQRCDVEEEGREFHPRESDLWPWKEKESKAHPCCFLVFQDGSARHKSGKENESMVAFTDLGRGWRPPPLPRRRPSSLYFYFAKRASKLVPTEWYRSPLPWMFETEEGPLCHPHGVRAGVRPTLSGFLVGCVCQRRGASCEVLFCPFLARGLHSFSLTAPC